MPPPTAYSECRKRTAFVGHGMRGDADADLTAPAISCWQVDAEKSFGCGECKPFSAASRVQSVWRRVRRSSYGPGSGGADDEIAGSEVVSIEGRRRALEFFYGFACPESAGRGSGFSRNSG